MTDFIGKGERKAQKIIQMMYPHMEVVNQCPLKSIISLSRDSVGEEHYKHKIDLVLMGPKRMVAIEVNLSHGKIAREKMEVYKEYLKFRNIELVEIEANECESLFSNDEQYITWQDWIDVINAFKTAGFEY